MGIFIKPGKGWGIYYSEECILEGFPSFKEAVLFVLTNDGDNPIPHLPDREKVKFWTEWEEPEPEIEQGRLL